MLSGETNTRLGCRHGRIDPFTDEIEKGTLRDALALSNWSISGAAKILNRVPSTVFGFLTRHPDVEAERLKNISGRSLSGRKPLIESSAALHAVLVRCDMDLQKCAEELKASPQTVRRWIKRYNLESIYLEHSKSNAA